MNVRFVLRAMAKLDQKTQAARRERILSAAEQCFARQGFHSTSIHDICREAGISAGALYVYYASKEDLISGLCEREKQDLAAKLANVAAAPDFMQGLAALAEAHTTGQPLEKLRLHAEINAEALRNPAVAEIVRAIDSFVLQSFERMLCEARDEGRINPAASPAAIARVLNLVGDGLCWQRALNPDFNVGDILPVMFSMFLPLINPVSGEAPPAGNQNFKDATVS